MKSIIILITVLLLTSSAFGQNIPIKVKSIPNKTVSLQGKLEMGKVMNDLSWAWSSQNACFPSTQQKGFNGNHVLYETQLPKRATVVITVKPKNPTAKINIYGYSVGQNSKAIVPNLPRCVSCEADNNQSKRARNNTRSIELRAVNNPYKVYFVVVGENGLQRGDYTISVKLIGGETAIEKTQERVIVKRIATVQKGKKAAYKDTISNGVFIHDLSWAWNSSVACFPSTQKQSFTGKHILFQTEIPESSEMTISIAPTNPKVELSLYGYQIGTTSNAVVPNLSRCMSCEADNNQSKRAKNNKRSINFTAINHPYKIMIGVSGANNLSDAEFIIQVEVKERR